MKDSTNWREVWEEKSNEQLSDFELDRGRCAVDQETEDLSERQLINFIEPKECETILDAGCGTGANILRLHSRVASIVGIDCTRGSLERCKRRIQAYKVANAWTCMASVTAIPLSDCSVNKVLSLSVFQYLNDAEVRQTLREFVRVLTPGGVVILHVKNFSSLYWSTLWFAKKLKALIGMRPQVEYFRSFQWYVEELKRLNFTILGYDSFNLLMVDRMPQRMVTSIRRFELKHHGDRVFRSPLLRRHGAELLLKARVPEA